MDGASAKTYEQIRVGLKYDTVVNNIDRFFALKKKRFSKILVTIQMVVNLINKCEIEAFRQHWSTKADALYLKTMHNFLDMNTSIKTTKLSQKPLYFCRRPFSELVIYWNGKTGLCCWDYDNFLDLGSVVNDKLTNVYNNQMFTKVRTALCKNNPEQIYPCRQCSQIYGQDMDTRYE